MGPRRRTQTGMDRTLSLPRPIGLPTAPRWALVALVVLAALAGSYLLVRDSSLVGVQDITITGVSGPEAPRLRRLLGDAARDMTTLHVREQQLLDVVEPYPVVKSVDVKPDFPHGLRIAVHQHVPVAVIAVDGQRTLVAADGTMLRGAGRRDLPAVPMTVAPGGDRIVDRAALAAIDAVAAAPAALRAKVARVGSGWGGVVLRLKDGPELRFGAPERLSAKWAAVARVLSDPSSAGATYLDVRWPERVAAGGLEDPEAQKQTAGSGQSLNP